MNIDINEHEEYIEDMKLGSEIIKNTINIYTDGACSGNPGPGGIGLIIKYYIDDIISEEEYNIGYKLTTNNRMELISILVGLDKIIKKIEMEKIKITRITITTDSAYVCNAINQNWLGKWELNGWQTGYMDKRKPVSNIDLWKNMIFYLTKIHSLGIERRFVHVKGHNGHEYNERCDKLATSAIRTNTLFEDKGYIPNKK